MLKKITTLRSRLFASIADRIARSVAEHLLSHPAHRDQIAERLRSDKDIRSQLFTDISDHWRTHHEISEDDVVEKVADWHNDSIDTDWLKRQVAEQMAEQLVDQYDDWDTVSAGITEEIVNRMDVSVDVTV